MRSTSLTPPTEETRMAIDDDEITFVSEIHASPTKVAASSKATTPRTPSTPSKSGPCKTPSPGKKRTRITATEADVATETDITEHDTPGKKQKRIKKAERGAYEQRFASEELETAAIKNKKKVAPSSPSKKRTYNHWTLQEDTVIIEHLLNSFDMGIIQQATGRSSSSIQYRFRTILKSALRSLHGEEHTMLPGEGSAQRHEASHNQLE
ncbi:uncharacterized protein UTRI_01750_B [Ustilago trichophora]|uniref:Myb-like domain-containing protein n=1 Tax=Ustilago trichophora TaxID=86804 RepID=A0A5C3E5D2_9BASI|nr:uncharacterized protein UTRI_01750_B [Ustilago trichophora]